MNVSLFHKPVRWIAGTEIGRPEMQRILVKPCESEVLRLRAFRLDGFHNQAEVRVVRRLQRHITSMRARCVSAEKSRCAANVAPSGLGELGSMRHYPKRGRHNVMPRPRLIALDKAYVVVGQVVVHGAHNRPIDGGRSLPGDIVAVDVARDFVVSKLLVEVGFAIPNWLSQLQRVGGGVAAPPGTMHSHYVNCIVHRRVPFHLRGDIPQLDLHPVIGSDNLDVGETVGAEGHPQILVERKVVAVLIAPAQIVDGQMMIGLRMFEPLDDVVNHVAGPVLSISHPVRSPPRQGDELDLRIARPGLLHQPPLVSAPVVLVRPFMHVARFGAVGRVHVRANFHLENLHTRAVVRLEKVVQNLAPIRLRVVDQQPGIPSAAADCAHAVKDPAFALPINDNGLPCCG